jgi:hypothetical protein
LLTPHAEALHARDDSVDTDMSENGESDPTRSP